MTTSLTASGLTRLHQVAPHVCATVRALDEEDADTERLKSMGLCVGRQVEVIKSGDPLILRIFGSRLGVSAKLASRVHVETCSAACACPVSIPPARP